MLVFPGLSWGSLLCGAPGCGVAVSGVRGVLAAAGAGMGLPRHVWGRAVPTPTVYWAQPQPQAWTCISMKIPPCTGHAACSCGREGPGKCFAVKTGACKARKITKQKGPAETSPPFLSQRLLGRCCRLWPCLREHPACPGEKRGAVLAPLLPAGTEPAARMAALPRANSTWLGAGALGKWRWVGQRRPLPLLAWAELSAPLGVRGQCVALPDAGLHLAVTSGSEGAPGTRQGARVLMQTPARPPAWSW